MELSTLTAISPLDGRYHQKLADLKPLFSEYGLMRLRLTVEVAWLKALSEEPQIQEVPPLGEHARHQLDKIVENFYESDAARIKNINTWYFFAMLAGVTCESSATRRGVNRVSVLWTGSAHAAATFYANRWPAASRRRQ